MQLNMVIKTNTRGCEMTKETRLKLIIDRVNQMKQETIDLYVIDVDYSHGIIFGVDSQGDEHEATWSGIIDVDEGDTITCEYNYNNNLIMKVAA